METFYNQSKWCSVKTRSCNQVISVIMIRKRRWTGLQEKLVPWQTWWRCKVRVFMTKWVNIKLIIIWLRKGMEAVIQVTKHSKIRLSSNISKEHQCTLGSLVGQCMDRFNLKVLHLVAIFNPVKDQRHLKEDHLKISFLSKFNKCKMVRHPSTTWWELCKWMQLVNLNQLVHSRMFNGWDRISKMKTLFLNS